MRSFVAVAVPAPVRMLLVRVQEALRRADADVKWVEEENFHVSLKFLGEIGEEPLAMLQELLSAEAPRWPRFRLSFGGTGVFPEHGAPRVVWAGCGGDLGTLAGLAGAVERAAEQVGVPRERRPFVAHLTIGRVRSDRRHRQLQAALEQQKDVPLGEDEVESFALYESKLSSAGPVYVPRARFELGAGSAGPLRRG